MTSTPPKLLQPAPAWAAILALVLFSLLGVGAGLGAMRYAFPAGAFVVAAFLYVRYPMLYIGFSWWLWFLTPFVRRLIDWRIGFTDPNPVLLAPYLATGLTFVTVIRYFPKAISGAGLPFMVSLLSVMYSLLIGLLNIPSKNSVIVTWLGWAVPITFGYHLFTHWRQFPELRQITQRVFLWAVLITGSYGVVQFLVAPTWDRLWLEGAIQVTRNYAFGRPAPLEMRVFSTMHSHQPFACFMVAGVLLLFASRSRLRLLAAGAGYLSLLLTLARSAWLSWVVGLVVFLPSLKPKLQIQLIVTLMLMMILVLPLTTIEPFSTVIGSRLGTLFLGSQDGSYIDRSQGYTALLGYALSEVVGRGMGFAILGFSIGGNDSGILSLLFTLGWVGTIPYCAGLLLLIVSILRGREAKFDPAVSAIRAIVIATFSQIGLISIVLAPFAIVLWGFIGMAIAARAYYETQRTSANPADPFQLPYPGQR